MAKVFEWDDVSDLNGNVAHIAVHGVTTDEAEFVVLDCRNRVDRSDSSTYPMTFGRTKTGKYLAVVWFARGDDPEVVRVITAYEVQKPRKRPR
jgi:uncharacterized DUF497 family protein